MLKYHIYHGIKTEKQAGVKPGWGENKLKQSKCLIYFPKPRLESF